MLNVPQLDDLDYSRIFGRARGKIPTIAPEWTNQNDADPGITLLQTFSWLYDSLNYYLNAAGDVHRLKYLKLLGIRPESAPASAVLALSGEGEICLPAGFRTGAQDTVFETSTPFCGRANRAVRLCAVSGSEQRELTGFAGVDKGFAPAFAGLAPVGSMLYLAFAHPLPAEPELYFEIEPINRNPFEKGFSLVKLVWEYKTESGWQPAQLLEDDTGGLLRSGFVRLGQSFAEKEEKQETVEPPVDFDDTDFSLRCRVAAGEYDFVPRIGRVLPCCVRAVQQLTWAQTLLYSYDGKDCLAPQVCVRANDLISVAVDETGSGEFEEWYRHAPDETDRCAVEQGKRPNLREIHFSKTKFHALPPVGAQVAITILSAAAAPSALLGVTDGCANQQLSFAAENVSALTLALVVPDDKENRRFTLWRRCADLTSAGCADRVFVFDEASQSVIFGDSIHGMEPKPNAQVWAVEVRTSRFDGGNVLAGQINTLIDEADGVQAVINPAAAENGRAMPTIAQLEAQLEKKLAAVNRAVTESDYRMLAKTTPGLCIDSVAVIPAAQYTAQPVSAAAVVLAVKPSSTQSKTPQLSEQYVKAITDRLSAARLLATEVKIVSPRYLGIAVYGRILLDRNAPAGPADIENELCRQIETVNTGVYGKRLDYGRLFAALELLPGVRGVAQLSLEYLGMGGAKTEHGDILTQPDVLLWLRETHLEYA